jgi:hypothetical protein
LNVIFADVGTSKLVRGETVQVTLSTKITNQADKTFKIYLIRILYSLTQLQQGNKQALGKTGSMSALVIITIYKDLY